MRRKAAPSGPTPGASVLDVRDVSKWYRDIEAVSHVSFAAAQGEFVSLLGPSGCGKTTTLRMIAGLETPSAGTISLEGRDVIGVPPFRRNTPMVWQSFALIPHLDVRANVEFGLKMRGVRATERRRRALAMLETVGLLELSSRPVDQLSSGQKQRAGLARALVMEPRLLLLDEPLAALDANLRVRMQSELLRIQRQFNIAFLFVTHSQSEALSMSDRIIVMNEGRVEQIDSPQMIYRR
ncbi:MAG: ABC transporter ATP-binding protein, partial [bacterium]